MGIIPTPNVYGDDCLECYAAGQTPNALKVFFSGIVKGDLWLPGEPLPPNGYHDIFQDIANPCKWKSLLTNPLEIVYDAGGGLDRLTADFRPVHQVFHDQLFVGCSVNFVNDLDNPVFHHYVFGSAYLSTSRHLAEIIESVTPMIDPDPRMECFPIDDEIIVVRYAGKRDATNISIKFDTTA